MHSYDCFERARRFVYQNARPLEFARWRYHFENGNAGDVLEILSVYQKADGGFGYALEPDNWNTDSTPIAAWMAAVLLNELDVDDPSQPIINGILNYLDSGKDFSDGKWYNTVAGNNKFPHAVWWGCDEGAGLPDDNPTVSLAGFALKYSDSGSALHDKAEKIVAKAVAEFIQNPVDEVHTLRNYMELLLYCEGIDGFNVFPLEAFRDKLCAAISGAICKDTGRWYTDYVCKPSFFLEKTNLIFKIADRRLCEQEAVMIKNIQLEDGSYPVTWQWNTGYKEFEISANWWKSSIILDNMLFLKALESRKA